MCSFQSVLNNKMALDQAGWLLTVDNQIISINWYKILLIICIHFDDFFRYFLIFWWLVTKICEILSNGIKNLTKQEKSATEF